MDKIAIAEREDTVDVILPSPCLLGRVGSVAKTFVGMVMLVLPIPLIFVGYVGMVLSGGVIWAFLLALVLSIPLMLGGIKLVIRGRENLQ